MHSHKVSKSKAGVSNIVFAISSAVLIIIAASGFGLYAMSQGHLMTSSTIETTSHSSMTSTGMMTTNANSNGTCACEFVPQSGAMISNAWLVTAPLRMGGYAVAIHAEGLEPNGTYLVEGSLLSGSMQIVPISNASMTMNHGESDSEFQADSNGTGQFWIELGTNPTTSFEAINLDFLPGMSMQNATLVATVNLTSMMTTTTSSMTGESMSG